MIYQHIFDFFDLNLFFKLSSTPFILTIEITLKKLHIEVTLKNSLPLAFTPV